MKTRHLGLLALLFSIGCTSVSYTHPEVATIRSYRTIAVLPVEMVFTGKAPAGWTAEQILDVEEAESLAFQTSLYGRLLERADRGRLDADVQPVDETNRLLGEVGVGVRESWSLPAEELAEILGVDAVARTRVEKTRYMSDLASFGIEAGTYVLYEIFDDDHDDHVVEFPWLFGLTKTHDISADGALVSGYDGTVLWQVEVYRSINWTRSANEVIEGITRKLARKFPYRS
jgi:hypothetical protein